MSMWSLDGLSIALLAGSIVAATVALVLLIRAGWRNHLRLEAYERAMGNVALRRRMYGNVGRHRRVVEAVVPAEHLRGWVWIRVTGRLPAPGEHKFDAHTEQMGWAMTKKRAQRALQREAAPERRPRARTEAGDVSELLLAVVGLVVVAAVLSKIGGTVSPGEVLDWLIDAAGRVLSAAWSAVS